MYTFQEIKIMAFPAVFQLSYPGGSERIFFSYVGTYLNTSPYIADCKTVQHAFSITICVMRIDGRTDRVSLMYVHFEPSVQIMHRNSLITKRA